MAAPQFFVPPRVTPSRSKRRFNLQQANSTLPLVKRIVADIVRVHQDVTTQQARIERLGTGSKKRPEAEKEYEKTLERLNALMNELGSVGCDIKDFQIGLVDFMGRHQGRDVCLCWKLGEETIGSWHEVDAGFPGRQPIDTLDEREQ